MSETVSAEKPEPGSEKSGAANELIEIVKTVVYALLIALFLRVIFFQPFTIPSASMEPNLYEGDYIIVSKWTYGYSHHSIPFSPPIFKGRIFEQAPKRGDIIVFKLPSNSHQDYVKRLVGLPGDRIQVTDGVLQLNGKTVARTDVGKGPASCAMGLGNEAVRYQEMIDNRTFVTNDCGLFEEQDNTEVFVVPAGYYFMMGDNRDNSLDSRVSEYAGGVGFVPAENLVGKAQIVLLSWNPEASIFKPWTWVLDARPSRFFKILK
jgi:signal peptidase I